MYEFQAKRFQNTNRKYLEHWETLILMKENMLK